MRSNIRPGLLLQALGMLGVLPELPPRRSEEVDLAASEQAMRELAEAGIDPAAVLEIAGRPSRFVELARDILAMHKTLLAQGQRITNAVELHERLNVATPDAMGGKTVLVDSLTPYGREHIFNADTRDVSRAGGAAELASQARAAVKSASWGAPQSMAIHDEVIVKTEHPLTADQQAKREAFYRNVFAAGPVRAEREPGTAGKTPDVKPQCPPAMRQRDRKAQRAHGVKRSKAKARRGW